MPLDSKNFNHILVLVVSIQEVSIVKEDSIHIDYTVTLLKIFYMCISVNVTVKMTCMIAKTMFLCTLVIENVSA